ncbi:MAG: hypothetical protein LUQ08_02010, partial [Methanothrix sp.]|nr:hypothetical protein [Methanothrix sp.]
MARIKIGFVSRQQPESVKLVGMLIRQIESEVKGVEIFVDQDIASQIGREGTGVAEMERQGGLYSLCGRGRNHSTHHSQ